MTDKTSSTVLNSSSLGKLQKLAEIADKRSRAHSLPKKLSLPLKIGTRASPLALVQTRAFMTRLTRFCPALREIGAFEEVHLKTSGDTNQTDRLADVGGKGLFSKEIHEFLLAGKIDFAVHSLKDLETDLPKGIVLGCTLRREDARDVLLLRDRKLAKLSTPEDPYACLPKGATIGCASVRRQAQILYKRPDLKFCLLRGNVQTRIDKLNAGQCDATLLALAGLRRVGMEDRVDVILEPKTMLPASGQGIVGITVRENDKELRDILAAVEDSEARMVATTERALLAELDGSCRTPIGGYATVKDDLIHLRGLIASEDGSFLLEKEHTGKDPVKLGEELGLALRNETPPDVFKNIIGQDPWKTTSSS